MSRKLDPATFAKAIIVESADIPADMTIAEWRRQRSAQRANRRSQRRNRSAAPTATKRMVTVPSALRVGRSS